MTEQWKNVLVFVEVQDHERILEGSKEMLTIGRKLADQLGESLVAVLLGLDANQYLPEIKPFNPDIIHVYSHPNLKHYNGEVFPDILEELFRKIQPSIVLAASTEAGSDLVARLAQRFQSGLTAHCSGLEIQNIPEYGEKLLVMKRPAFSGNITASIICPKQRPQFASVQQGVFKQDFCATEAEPQVINHPIDLQKDLNITQIESPQRWQEESISLEQSPVIIAGGNGLGNKETFQKLHELASLLGGEVGATRIPVFKKWCEEDRMIGQTGKIVRPDVYIAFGISGQIQHSSGMIDSKRIISINSNPRAPIVEMSDYIFNEDAAQFLNKLIQRIKKEVKKC